MTLFRKFLILFRTLFFFVRSELYIKQAEAIDLRLLVTRIQFPASRSRLPDVGCRSSSAPTPSGHWLSRPPSRPRCLRIVLPAEERVPAPAPRCLRGVRPASRRSAGYNTVSGDASSDKLAAAGRKRRWGVLLRAVSKHRVGNSRLALCKCRPTAQIAIPYVILPFKISPAGLQRKMHPSFGYSLPKPKGRCEYANFQIAHYFFCFIFLLNSFSVWICQRLLRVMERKVREQKKSTRKIFGMQNFSPF